MAELGVDVLVASHGAEMPWLTGYRAMPLERLTVLALGLIDEPVLLVPALEAPRVPPSAVQEGVAVRPWHETEDPLELAAGLIRRCAQGSQKPTVAVSDRSWATTLLGLQRLVPGARWTAASAVIGPLRACKEPDEIAALAEAAAAADRVAAQLQGGEVALAGRSEVEVSADIAARLQAEGHQQVNFAIVASGPNGASPHHEPTSRRLGDGDVVVCDFGGTLSLPGGAGYCSDITRTVAVGSPGPVVCEWYEVLHAAQQAGVAAARAGVAAEAVDGACRQVIEEAGLGQYFIHRTGHGIGLDEHEDPYLVAGNAEVLAEGQVFSVEPGLYLPGRFGMRLEDIVMIRDGEPVRLNQADHGLASVAC